MVRRVQLVALLCVLAATSTFAQSEASRTASKRAAAAGPIYATVERGNSLVADVRSPTQNIMEAYLLCIEMLQGSGETDVDALEQAG